MRSWNNQGPILGFFCNWDPYLCWMEMGRCGKTLSYVFSPIKTMCAGRVDPAMVLYAFERGAEGVMVLGCREGDCRYGPGPNRVERLSKTVHGLMHVLGLEPERFLCVQCSAEDMEALFQEMSSFGERVARLGRSPWCRRPPGDSDVRVDRQGGSRPKTRQANKEARWT